MKRLMLSVALVVTLLVIGAFWLHWLTVTAATRHDEATLGVTFDNNKVRQDVNAARQKAEALKAAAEQKARAIQEGAREQLERQAGTATFTAVITKVDPANHWLTLVNQDDSVTVTVTPKTKIMHGNKEVTLRDLTVGDMATATYMIKEQGHPATSIKVANGG